jgi:ankyrin repeat protein
MKKLSVLLFVSAFLLSIFSITSIASASEIHDAVRNGDALKVKQLLNKNPKLVNDRDRGFFTPLHLAAYNGNEKIASMLISKGADINATGKCDYTPLHVAAEQGQMHLAKLLLSHGAKVNMRTAVGTTALRLALDGEHYKTAEIIRKRGGKE